MLIHIFPAQNAHKQFTLHGNFCPQQSQMAIPCTVVQEHSQMFTKLNCTHSLSRTLIPHAYFLPRTFTNIPTQSLPSACNMQSAPG